MGSNGTFFRSRGSGRYHIAERQVGRYATQSARLPFTQIILNPAFTRLPKQSPRLPGRTWHHCNFREFSMSVFRPIAAPQRLYQADNLTPLFKACFQERAIDQVGKQGIGRNENMCPRNQYSEGTPRKTRKELSKAGEFIVRQNREARQWTTDTSVKCRRDSPHPTPASAQLTLLLCGIFLQAVRWIGDNGMNRIRRLSIHPHEAVG